MTDDRDPTAIPDHIPVAIGEPTEADDDFHPPTDDDPFWTETCWFTFTVPERRLSGQLYPFFRPNQGVMAAAVYLWDEPATRSGTAATPRTSGTSRSPTSR